MTDAGEWLINTAKRNPEALLVIAAGCALLIRGGTSSYLSTEHRVGAPGPEMSWNVSRQTDEPSAIGRDLKDRIADAGSSVTERGSEMVGALSNRTSQIAGRAQSTLSSGFGQLLRDQPLALVAAGLAIGAVVAALLPATDLEERTLGGARDAISDMAGKVGENLVATAQDAGQQLTQKVTERAAEEFKEVAKDVVGQVTENVTGVTDKPGGRPGNVSPRSSRGT